MTAAAVLNEELQASDRTFRGVGLHAPGELAAHLLDDDTTVVVVDVVRCSTTITGILARGATCVHVRVKGDDGDIADVTREHPRLERGVPHVYGGEKHGRAVPGGAFGNSVLELPDSLAGKDVVFYSTNFGRAWTSTTAVIGPDEPVVVACLANVEETAAVVRQTGRSRVVVVCGGFYERLSLEDAVAGGRLLRLLDLDDGDLDDGAISMVALADVLDGDDRLLTALRRNRIGRALEHYGRVDDIAAVVTGVGVPSDLWDAMRRTVGRIAWVDGQPLITTDPKELR